MNKFYHQDLTSMVNQQMQIVSTTQNGLVAKCLIVGGREVWLLKLLKFPLKNQENTFNWLVPYVLNHFNACFFSGEGNGRNRAGRLEIPHDFQQSLIVLLAPHQDETKQGRRYNRASWSLDDLWVAFLWV